MLIIFLITDFFFYVVIVSARFYLENVQLMWNSTSCITIHGDRPHIIVQKNPKEEEEEISSYNAIIILLPPQFLFLYFCCYLLSLTRKMLKLQRVTH